MARQVFRRLGVSGGTTAGAFGENFLAEGRQGNGKQGRRPLYGMAVGVLWGRGGRMCPCGVAPRAPRRVRVDASRGEGWICLAR